MRLKINFGKIFYSSLILFFLFSIGLSTSYAIEYKVKKGDNLPKIARKYKVTVKEIQLANKISPERLMPGDKIIIPEKNKIKKKNNKVSSEKDKGTNITLQNRNLQSTKDRNKDIESDQAHMSGVNQYHTVKKGESLLSIAKKYSITVQNLKDMNDLKSTKLKKGQKILVKQHGRKYYIVKKGDNIWSISRKYNIDPDDLMGINDLEDDSLKIGQKLWLEDEVIDHTETQAKNEQIAKKFEEELKKIAESGEFKQQDTPNKIIAFAKKMLNIPYRFGGNTIFGIDCSAYVKKVYGMLGINLPRTAREQFNEGETIDKESLSVGDLVFFRTYASFPSHVGIYIGNNMFIHASSKGKKVTIDNLDAPYYFKRFIGAKRLITEENISITEPKS